MSAFGHISSMINSIAENRRQLQRIRKSDSFMSHGSEDVHIAPRRKSVESDKERHDQINKDQSNSVFRDVVSLIVVVFLMAATIYYLWKF